MAWMSEEQAATVLGVPFRTIRRRVGNGSLRTRLQGSTLLVEVEVADASLRKGPLAKARPPVEPIPPAVASDIRTGPAEPIHAPVAVPPSRVPPLLLSSGTLPAHCANATVTDAPAGSVEPKPGEHVNRRAGLWATMTAWGAVAVALGVGLTSISIVQHTRTSLRAVERDLADARTTARRAQVAYEQAMSGEAARARAAEAELTAESSRVRGELERTTARLNAERAAMRESRRMLSLAERTASVQDARLQQLGRRLAFARASAAAQEARALLANRIARLSGSLRGMLARSISTPVPPDTALASVRAPEPQDRWLPAAAPTLTEDDRTVRLRPLLR